LVKIPDFGHFFSLDGMNSVFWLKFLAVGFCPKNLAFARKIMALPESGGLLQPPAAPWLVVYGLYMYLVKLAEAVVAST